MASPVRVRSASRTEMQVGTQSNSGLVRVAVGEVARIWRRATAGTQPAVVLDAYRLLAGLCVSAYFVSLLRSVDIFSGTGGLIDHDLSFRLYWFTRYGLLQPGVPSFVPVVLLWFGLLLSLAIAAGIRPRVAAGLCFVVCVSIQHWNFLVYYVEDMVIQLVLFWLVLMPVGYTLKLRFPIKSLRDSATLRVPSFSTRMFLLNIGLIYFVAGITKLSSQMWRSGWGLYAVLKLPLSRMHDVWAPASFPALRALNFIALATEIVIPLMLLSRPLRARQAGLCLQLGMHTAIFITIGFPFANLVLPAASLLFFREETATVWFGFRPQSQSIVVPRVSNWAQIHSASYLVILSVSCLHGIQILRPLIVVAFTLLWGSGLAQNYYLLNWIDQRHYVRTIEVRSMDSDALWNTFEHKALFPDDTRSVLLEMNLYDIAWLPAMDRNLSDELKCSILLRTARRFCAESRTTPMLTISSSMATIDPGFLAGSGAHRIDLMTLSCGTGSIKTLQPLVSFRRTESAELCRVTGATG
jgi:hypothetical protein